MQEHAENFYRICYLIESNQYYRNEQFSELDLLSSVVTDLIMHRHLYEKNPTQTDLYLYGSTAEFKSISASNHQTYVIMPFGSNTDGKLYKASMTQCELVKSLRKFLPSGETQAERYYKNFVTSAQILVGYNGKVSFSGHPDGMFYKDLLGSSLEDFLDKPFDTLRVRG